MNDDPLAVYLASKRAPDPRFVEPDEPRPPPRQYPAAGRDLKATIGTVPPPSVVESLVGGGLQGATAGHFDEGEAAIEGALGGRPYAQVRDENRARFAAEKAAHPAIATAGEVAGGLATAPLTGPTAGLRGLATAAGMGALAGEGFSEAKDLKGVALDTAKGAAVGAGANLVGKGIGRIVKGAPARDEARVMEGLTEGVKQKVANRVTNEVDRVTEVMKEPAFRRAVGDPAKLAAEVEKGFETAKPAADRILDVADRQAAAAAGKVGHGGMRVQDVTEPLYALRRQLVEASANPSAVSTVDRVIDQFRSGIGRDNNALVPATTVRKFLTDQVQRDAFKGDPLGDPAGHAKEALQRVSGVLKDALTGHVQKYASDTAVSAVRKLWDRMTAFSTIKAAAADQAARAARAPGPVAGIAANLHSVRLTPEAAAGGAVAGLPGAIVAGTVGAGVRKLAGPVDRALATPAGQALGQAGASATGRALPTPLIDALTTKDDEKGKAALAHHIFGELD